MELSAVLALRDKMSTTLEKASKGIGGMEKRVNAAREAITRLSANSAINVTAKSNISDVVSAGKNRLAELQRVVNQKSLVLNAQFGGDLFDPAVINAEIKKAESTIDKAQQKIKGMGAGTPSQLIKIKDSLAEIDAAQQALSEWRQMRIEYDDLQKAQEEVKVLEAALGELNKTNVAARAYVNFKNDALQQVYDIDDKLKSLGKLIVSPIVNLKDKALEKTSAIRARLSALGAKVTNAVVSLVDKTKGGLSKVKTGLARVAGTVAYPIVKLKDLATKAISKVTSPLKYLAGKIFAPVLKITDRLSATVKKAGAGLKSIVSKTWTATVAAKDKLTGVLGGIKDKVLNLKNLLGGLVVGAGLTKGLQSTVGGAMKLEQQQVSMKHFIGVTNKGASEADVQSITDTYISDLRKNANATPFETGEVIAAGSRAVAIASGDTKEAMSLVTLAEDMAAASGGTKSISDAMEALADLKVGEGERMKEFGFKISAEDFKSKGFSGVSEELKGFFGGAAGKLATTGSGLVSTIMGSGKSALTDMGKGGLELLKPQLQQLADMMTDNEFMGGIIQKGSELVSNVVGFGIKVVGFFKDNWPTISQTIKKGWAVIQPIISVFTKTFGGLGKVLTGVLSGKKIDLASVFPSQGDISGAIDALINVAIPFGSKLITALLGGFAGLATGLAAQAPALISAAIPLLTALVDGIVQNLPQILQAAIGIISALADGIGQALPILIPAALQAILTLINGIALNLPTLVTSAITIIQGLVTGIIQALPLLIEQAPVIITNLVNGIVASIPLLVDAAVSLITELLNFILGNLDTIIVGALQIVIALAVGLIQAIPELLAAIPKLIMAVINCIMETDWLKVGGDIISGIANGLIDGVKAIGDTIAKVGEDIVSGFKNFFGIKSPSRLMKAKIGFQIGAGVVDGMDDTKKLINKETEDISNGIAVRMKPELPEFPKPPKKPEPPEGDDGGAYSNLDVASPTDGGDDGRPSRVSNGSTKKISIKNLIGQVTVTSEADEDRLVRKIIAALADDIEETAENMGEEDSE